MSRGHCRERVVSNTTGLPLANAVVTVREVGTTTALAATMYDALSGGATVSNPITTGADGVVEFYLDAPQDVDFRVVAAGYPDATISSIKAHYDQGDLVSKDATQTLTNKTLTSPTITGGTISGTTISGQLLLGDGSESAPGLAFANSTGLGLRRVSADYGAITAGGQDAVRILGLAASAPFGPRVGLGNVDEPGATDNPENLFHIHYSGAANSNGVVGITSSITDNATAARALPSVTPDPSAGSFILAQTSAAATGAGRAVEAHAIRAAALSAGGTWMIHESGIHTGTAGNWSAGISGVPKTMGYWLSSYADSVMVGLGVTAVPADVGLYINEGFSSATAGGFYFPIAYQRFVGGVMTTAFTLNRNGNLAVGTANNAVETGYGFVGEQTKGMFDAGSQNLAFSTASTEAVRIDQNQNVGIGTGTIASGTRLHVAGGLLRAAGGVRNDGVKIGNLTIPTALAADTDNYVPSTGLTSSTYQISSSVAGPIELRGLALGQTVAGHEVTLINGGGNTINIMHNSATSPANSFNTHTGATHALAPARAVTIQWTGAAWRFVSLT